MKIIKNLSSLFGDKPYEVAISFYNRHNYPQAVNHFESYMNEKPDSKKLNQTLARFYHSQANMILGEVEFTAGKYDEAVRYFLKAAQNDENHPGLSKYIGACYENMGMQSESMKYFHKVLQTEPVMLSSVSELRMMFYQESIWQVAIDSFKKMIADNENFADVYFHLGLAYIGIGDTQNCLECLKESLHINSRYVLPRRKLGIVLAKSGYHDEALENFNQVLKWFPGYADMHYYSGIVHATNGRMEEALISFKSALGINPSYMEAKTRLGILLLHLGKPEEGMQNLVEVLKADMDNQALKNMLCPLNIYFEEIQKGNIPESIDWLLGDAGIFSKAISMFTDTIIVIPNLSEMLTVLSNIPEIEEPLFARLFPIMTDILKQHPNYSDIHNFLGTFYLKAGLFEKAVESFKNAKQKNPEYLKARLNLFHTLKEPRNLEEVLKEGEELLQKNLSYPDFLYALAEVYDAVGMFDRAEDVLEIAIEKKPHFTQALFLLAQILQKKGNMEKAMAVLKDILGREQTKAEMQNAEKVLGGLANKHD